MLGSPSVSDEFILTALWAATLAMTAASFVVLAILFVRRSLALRRSRIAAAKKAHLTKVLLSALTLRDRLPETALPDAGEIELEIAVDAALDLLRSIEGSDKQFITKILRRWNSVSYLENMLRYGRRGRKIRALTLLSYFDEPETLPLIAAQTEASDPYVQLSAIRALADRGAVSELPRIIKALTETKGVNPVMLADVLCRFGPKAGPALLRLAIARTAALGTRVAALRAMNAVGEYAPLKVLKALLNDPSPEIRAKAVTLLPKSDAGAVGACVMKALRDPSAFVRIRAARMAGEMNVTAAAPLLVLALKDDDWWMRYRAAEALSRFGGKGAQILKVIAKGADEAAATAAQVIAEKRVVNA